MVQRTSVDLLRVQLVWFGLAENVEEKSQLSLVSHPLRTSNLVAAAGGKGVRSVAGGKAVLTDVVAGGWLAGDFGGRGRSRWTWRSIQQVSLQSHTRGSVRPSLSVSDKQPDGKKSACSLKQYFPAPPVCDADGERGRDFRRDETHKKFNARFFLLVLAGFLPAVGSPHVKKVASTRHRRLRAGESADALAAIQIRTSGLCTRARPCGILQ